MEALPVEQNGRDYGNGGRIGNRTAFNRLNSEEAARSLDKGLSCQSVSSSISKSQRNPISPWTTLSLN